ncbi:helix-turn-helix domain-containing protein [Neisseria weixii]|uniref:helix-turn-helix domain-containing protein n=1 Tax=Neisseria weixii TaxID=1853276 RepID=UPI001E648E8C|nr:helix-turn-helix domain-containing protein [Neisseria weixii]
MQVVNYYLEGHGEKHTAKVFCLGHAAVRKRATRYVLHGGDGINRWSGITVYPLDFKSNAVRMVINEGLSQKGASARLNLPTGSLLTQWLCRYRQYGTGGLKAKPEGRKPVKKPKQPEAAPKAGHLKTKEGLMEELLYLRAGTAVLKKPDALIREDGVRQSEAGSSQD